MKILIAFIFAVILGCFTQTIAGKGHVCVKKIYSFYRVIQSRGAYPSDEVSNDGTIIVKKKLPQQLEYFIYVETNCSTRINVSSLTIDGRPYKTEQMLQETPVITADINTTELIKTTDNTVFRLKVKPMNVQVVAKAAMHKIVVKGTLNKKPFVLTDTAKRLTSLIAQ